MLFFFFIVDISTHSCHIFQAHRLSVFTRFGLAIRGGSATLNIFSSGTDAAGCIRSDVSAKPKLAAKTIHGCIVLAQMRRIFSKVLPNLPFLKRANPKV